MLCSGLLVDQYLNEFAGRVHRMRALATSSVRKLPEKATCLLFPTFAKIDFAGGQVHVYMHQRVSN